MWYLKYLHIPCAINISVSIIMLSVPAKIYNKTTSSLLSSFNPYYDEHHKNNKQNNPSNNKNSMMSTSVPVYNNDEQASPEENIISVRPVLVVGGYASSLTIAIFAIVLVSIAPEPDIHGAMLFISEGMLQHCGWSIVVMGTCSIMLFMCLSVAAAHMARHIASFWVIVQALGWFVVLGVVDTGWMLHYVGLSFFLVGNICYHWIASRDRGYGSLAYQKMNMVCVILTISFIMAGAVSILIGEHREIKSCAVSLEFALLFGITIQNLFLIRALDRFKVIHLVFDERQ